MVSNYKHTCPRHGLETCECYDGVGEGSHLCRFVIGNAKAFKGRRMHKAELYSEARHFRKA